MLDFPKAILIDNSSYCNLRCTMCDYTHLSDHRKKQIMPIPLYTKIIDNITEVNQDVRVWEIFVGDPCCCPDMAYRILYAKSKGLTDVVLNTNGNALSSKRSEGLIAAGLDIMYIGIDAMSTEVYSKIRVGGNLAKVVKNTLDYRDLLARKGNKKQQLFVQFVACDLNEHEKESFIEFWKKEGINVKTRVRGSWAGIIPAPNLDPHKNRTVCKWAMETMVICTDGRVAMCAVDAHCAVPSGNVNSVSVQQAWSGELATYRKLHVDGKFDALPTFCRNCLDWQTGIGEYNPINGEQKDV